MEKEKNKPTEFIQKNNLLHLQRGWENSPTYSFLLNGILMALDDNPGFLSELLWIHCFLEDDYTLVRGQNRAFRHKHVI